MHVAFWLKDIRKILCTLNINISKISSYGYARLQGQYGAQWPRIARNEFTLEMTILHAKHRLTDAFLR